MPRKKASTIEDVVIGAPRGRQSSLGFTLGLVVVGIVVIGGAVMIGKSDTGPINVVATIQESNKNAASEGREEVETTPPIFQSMPNGGLVAAENQEALAPAPAEQPTEGASTTATSTEEVSGEEGTEETPTQPIEESAGE